MSNSGILYPFKMILGIFIDAWEGSNEFKIACILIVASLLCLAGGYII